VPDVKTVIAGRGKLLDRLKEEVSGMGLEKNIDFLGYREDIPQLLQAMDIFILPSLSEGTPLSILEAMASLKPVVATDVGGLSEIIENGETGFLVPSKDPGSLAAKILLVLENRDLAEKMAAAARKKVVCEYDLSIMVRKYVDLYEGMPELH
jgi:glycosyltransferase involved in cell wall biosynthesis